MRRQFSALFLVALVLGTVVVSPAALRQFCEDHGRFCLEFAFAAPSCGAEEVSDCCGEIPCEEGGGCLAAPFPSEWVAPSAKGELEPPRWVEYFGVGAAELPFAMAAAPALAPLRSTRAAPPPQRGRPLVDWFMVRLI